MYNPIHPDSRQCTAILSSLHQRSDRVAKLNQKAKGTHELRNHNKINFKTPKTCFRLGMDSKHSFRHRRFIKVHFLEYIQNYHTSTNICHVCILYTCRTSLYMTALLIVLSILYLFSIYICWEMQTKNTFLSHIDHHEQKIGLVFSHLVAGTFPLS